MGGVLAGLALLLQHFTPDSTPFPCKCVPESNVGAVLGGLIRLGLHISTRQTCAAPALRLLREDPLPPVPCCCFLRPLYTAPETTETPATPDRPCGTVVGCRYLRWTNVRGSGQSDETMTPGLTFNFKDFLLLSLLENQNAKISLMILSTCTKYCTTQGRTI